MSLFLAAFLLSVNLGLAAPEAERRNIYLFTRQSDICTENDQVDCDSSCMPVGSVCCNDGSGTFCDAGDVCVTGGCCPIGQRCSGGGGTMTYDLLTGTGSLPTATAKNTAKTTVAGPDFSSPTVTTSSGGSNAASSGWSRDFELSTIVLMVAGLLY